MADRITRKDVQRIAEACGIHVATWSPGDGVTRFRLFVKDDAGGTDYFGGSHPLVTTLGAREAYTWLEGYRAAQIVRDFGSQDVRYAV